MAEQQGVSEFLSQQLSEIANQLGQTASQIEALREDIRDESQSSRTYRENMSSRVDNIAMRVGKLEEATAITKGLLDAQVMPLVEAAKERKQQLNGALRVWGAIVILATSLGTVFWSRLLNWALWITGHGPVE